MYIKTVPFFRKIRNSIYERRSEQRSFPYPCHTLMLHRPVICNYFCSKHSARILASKKMGFIYLLTLAVIISFVLLTKCGRAVFH